MKKNNFWQNETTYWIINAMCKGLYTALIETLLIGLWKKKASCSGKQLGEENKVFSKEFQLFPLHLLRCPSLQWWHGRRN
mmetsp:Transcript_46367/g.77152  ORF Transcript_46367/g.77152 Transcript_46367/m.77152 type:complete len:80 (-) Transcript_46367:139-378(-)